MALPENQVPYHRRWVRAHAGKALRARSKPRPVALPSGLDAVDRVVGLLYVRRPVPEVDESREFRDLRRVTEALRSVLSGYRVPGRLNCRRGLGRRPGQESPD